MLPFGHWRNAFIFGNKGAGQKALLELNKGGW
jgi:hypothetical protein